MSSQLFLNYQPKSLPKLAFCAREIAYDNGMVHRQAPEEAVLAQMYDNLLEGAMRKKFNIIEVETWLETQSDEALLYICQVSEGSDAPPDVDACLNYMFQGC